MVFQSGILVGAHLIRREPKQKKWIRMHHAVIQQFSLSIFFIWTMFYRILKISAPGDVDRNCINYSLFYVLLFSWNVLIDIIRTRELSVKSTGLWHNIKSYVRQTLPNAWARRRCPLRFASWDDIIMMFRFYDMSKHAHPHTSFKSKSFRVASEILVVSLCQIARQHLLDALFLFLSGFCLAFCVREKTCGWWLTQNNTFLLEIPSMIYQNVYTSKGTRCCCGLRSPPMPPLKQWEYGPHRSIPFAEADHKERAKERICSDNKTGDGSILIVSYLIGYEYGVRIALLLLSINVR